MLVGSVETRTRRMFDMRWPGEWLGDIGRDMQSGS